ncbi:hypothetical protein BDV3_006428 [Batrachochytrium dendrobatidis]|nr:endoplasmic oxidoreductin-1 [Batrachochytrium dendrobatidis]
MILLSMLIATALAFGSAGKGLSGDSPFKKTSSLTPLKSILSLKHCSLPSGTVKDTCCKFETAQGVNARLFPVLDELVKTTVFRYFKVNLQKQCPFWNENFLCFGEHCSVTEADEHEIPEKWRTEALSSINWEASKSKGLKLVKQCEFNEKDFCQLDDELTEVGNYVDLVKNPERFTGYSGESSERVWGAIYKENCFQTAGSHLNTGNINPLERNIDDVCTEKRVFYKLISGLHSSISMHICDQWFNQITGEWVHNLDCYVDRIAKFPSRLENLYFLWAIVVRSASKLAPYLANHPFCDGTQDERLVKAHVDQVAKIVSTCPSTFDESTMFAEASYLDLKDEFKLRFRNISLIMDCIGCEKCRLWGKLQITGLGTALKVLFSYGNDVNDYRLSRYELIAFMNVFHRLSESLMAVERFQTQLSEKLEVEKSANGHVGSVVGKMDKKSDFLDGVKQELSPGASTFEASKTKAEPTQDSIVDTPRVLTSEYLLLHTELFQPEHSLLYIIGFIIVVLGMARLLYKAYDKNIRVDMQAAKDRMNAKNK